MADEEGGVEPEAGGTGDGANPAAIALALGKNEALDPRAASFLEKQEQLTDLQIEYLSRKDEFELSHLRFRELSDYAQFALQAAAALLVLALTIGIGAAVWNAANANGIVVESFSVPPSFTQNGMTGDVVADDMTRKIAAVRNTANAYSIATSKDVQKELDESIKVEIPQTGLSFSDVSRLLRAWLGHEHRLSGNLRVTGPGRVTLSVALDRGPAADFSGAPGDLDALEKKAAEYVFQSFDPSNYAVYLDGEGRSEEMGAAVLHLIRAANTPGMLSDGYSLWGARTRTALGDPALAIARLKIAAAIDPKALPPHMELMHVEQDLGHDENMLREADLIPTFRQADQYAWREGTGFSGVVEAAAILRDEALGDFQAAQTTPCEDFCTRIYRALPDRAEYAARLHDVRTARALIDEALAMDGTGDVARARYFAFAEAENWAAAIAAAKSYRDRLLSKNLPVPKLRALTFAAPLLATALAHTGDFPDARAAIHATPGDCVACDTARGNIDAVAGNPGGAAYWYARAIHDAPSIPFAYFDWGVMLLRQGRYDAAIAKFAQANKNGPHFADPLEMWGEALMQKNRSDLALAKFEEANKYAPNWGRLHLKWGEALAYAGQEADALAQYRIAATLDLNPSDKAELAKENLR